MSWRAIKRCVWNLVVAGAAFVPVVAVFALFVWPQAIEGGFEVRDLIGDFIFFGPYTLAFWWIVVASAVVAAINRVTGRTVTRRLLLAVLGGSSAVKANSTTPGYVLIDRTRALINCVNQ